MAEEIVAARFTIPAAVDLSQVEKQLKEIEKESARAGKKSGEAFGSSSQDVGGFTSGVKGAATAVTGFAMIVADRATSAVRGLFGWLGKSTAGLIDLGAYGVLKVSQGMREMAESTRDAEGELSAIGKAGVAASSGLEVFAKTAITVSGIILGLKVGAALLAAKLTKDFVVAANEAAAGFTPAWNRVRTLLDESTTDVEALRAEVSGLAGDLRSSGDEAANTLYEILGAMPELAKEPTRALAILEVSLEAASTGFTGASEAAKTLVAIMNAYDIEAERAREVSDALFAAQDQGTTTFGEVGDAIGRVSGLASALNVDFRDLLGIIATITPSGAATAEVITQIRAALTNILKPSAKAAEAAEELGIDFSAAALEGKGLNAFLLEMIELTDGNPAVLARFFGSDEALNLITSLAQQTEVLQEKTDAVGNSAGRTAAAAAKMNDGWKAQKDLLDDQLSDVLRQIGFQFEDIGTSGVKAANAVLGAWRSTFADLRRMQEEHDRQIQEMIDQPRGRDNPFLLPAVGARAPVNLDDIPIISPAEPTGLDYSREKIASQRLLTEARAVADLAASGNLEQYERATRDAQAAVNQLVLSEMARLRTAGVEEAQIAELASLYSHLADQHEAAERTVRAALERRSTEAERHILQLREEEAAAREIGRVDLAAQWEKDAAALEQLNAWAKRFTPELAGAAQEWPEQIGRSVGSITAEFAARMNELKEQLARGLIDPQEFERLGREAAEAFNAGILSRLAALREAGRLTREEYEKLVGVLKQVAEANPDESAEKQARVVADTAREYANVARSVLSVADAMGDLDDETRQTIEGVILLLENLAAMQGAIEAGTALSMGNIVGVIGGIASLVSSFVGASKRAEEEQQAAREAIYRQMETVRENTRALDELRVAMLQDISTAEKERLENTLAPLAWQVGLGFAPSNTKDMDDLRAYAEANGMDVQSLIAQLERLEELTGSEFFDAEKGITNMEEFQRALETFMETGIGAFGTDIEGRMDALDYMSRVAGDALGTAAEQMQLFIDTLMQIDNAEGFAKEFQRLLTEQGPEAARAWLQEQARLFALGGNDALGEWAAGLSSAEIQRLIEEGLERTAPGGIAGGGAVETRLAVNITEVQANQLLMLASTQVHYQSYLPKIYEALTGRVAIPNAQIALPSPAAGAGGLVQDFRGLTVQVAIDAPTGGPSDRHAWQEAGVAIGEGFKSSLKGRRDRALRAHGASGQTRIPADAGGMR